MCLPIAWTTLQLSIHGWEDHWSRTRGQGAGTPFIYLPPKSGIDLTSVDSGSFCWRDRTASTLDTIASVGICLGVTECLSPEESICVSISSKGPEEIFLTQLASGLRRLAFFVSLFRFRAVLLLSARLSAIVCIVLSKVVGKSCLSLSSRSYILL